MNDLQQLDEALNYLNGDIINEGAISKIIKHLKDKTKEKEEKIKKKEKDKKDIAERGYDDWLYNYAKSRLEEWNKYNDEIPFGKISIYNLGSDLYYAGISESKFISEFNKKKDSLKKNQNFSDLDMYDDDFTSVIGENDYYTIGSEPGEYLIYIPKTKKFVNLYYHIEEFNINPLSYSELLNLGKSYMYNGTSVHGEPIKAFKAADEDLGFNKLK